MILPETRTEARSLVSSADGKQSFAGTCPNDEVAPIAAVRHCYFPNAEFGPNLAIPRSGQWESH
jgi:hypothetical protein